ncbi:MAG: hypothetical protein KGR24_03340 [Planctomycetes bacterium]|nr:hypothetical protein [Planctomycetota bacterium]
MAASAGAIRAGEAFVEISARDSAFQTSLARIRQQMATLGRGMAMGGAAGLAIGTGVIGSIVASAQAFASVGAALDDMSQRTGVAAEELSILKFAADQSGTEMAAVETGVRKMQKAIFEAGNGSKEAAAALGMVGLTAGQLQGMTADQQMAMIADGLMAIPDAGTRAAVAMSIFGKSGTSLLPMLAGGSAGMQAFADEAQRLGLVMSSDTAAKAAVLDDAIAKLKMAFTAAFIQVGAAVAPILTQVAETLSTLAGTVGQYIAENSGMVVGVLKAAAALTAISGVIMTVGGVLSGLSTIIGGVQASFGVLSSLSVLLSPVGLVAGGVAAAIGLIAVAARQLSPEFKEATDALLGLNAASDPAASEADAAAKKKAAQQAAATAQAAEDAKAQAEAQRAAEEQARKEQEKAAREREALMQKGQQVKASVATPEEQLQERIKELQQLREAGAIDTTTFTRAIDEAKQRAAEALGRGGSGEQPDRQFSSAGTFGSVAGLGIGPELAKLEDPAKQTADNTRATVDAIAALALGETAAPTAGQAAADELAGVAETASAIPASFEQAMNAAAGLSFDAINESNAPQLTETERLMAEAEARNLGAITPPPPTALPIGAEVAAPRAVATQAAITTGTQEATTMATLNLTLKNMSAQLVAAADRTTEAVRETVGVLKQIADNTTGLGGSFL